MLFTVMLRASGLGFGFRVEVFLLFRAWGLGCRVCRGLCLTSFDAQDMIKSSGFGVLDFILPCKFFGKAQMQQSLQLAAPAVPARRLCISGMHSFRSLEFSKIQNLWDMRARQHN